MTETEAEIQSDAKTLAVQRMYREFPYPPEFSGWHKRKAARKLLKKGSRMGKALLDIEPGLASGRILDVGCGTGLRTIGLAKALPNARIVGIELSENSREQALANARKRKVTNFEVQQGDFFLAETTTEPYDAVHCGGMLHHLSDPDAGLKKLLQSVKPGGLIWLSVYGKYGRADILRIGEAITLVEPKLDAFKERLYVLRSFLGPQRDKKADNDSFAVDYWLHIQERHYEIGELLDLFEQNGGELISWPRFDRYVKKHIHNDAVRQKVLALPLRERYRVIELLAQPKLVHVVARRRI